MADFLNGLVRFDQVVVLLFLAADGEAIEDGGAEALFVVVVVEVDPAALLVLAGAGKGAFGPGLSGKAITGKEAPVDGAPGVNWRFVKPFEPVVAACALPVLPGALLPLVFAPD